MGGIVELYWVVRCWNSWNNWILGWTSGLLWMAGCMRRPDDDKESGDQMIKGRNHRQAAINEVGISDHRTKPAYEFFLAQGRAFLGSTHRLATSLSRPPIIIIIYHYATLKQSRADASDGRDAF